MGGSVAQPMCWVGVGGWSKPENNATLWLHLASLNLPDSQMRIQDGAECGNIYLRSDFVTVKSKVCLLSDYELQLNFLYHNTPVASKAPSTRFLLVYIKF